MYVDEAIAIQSVPFDPFGAEIELLYQFDEVNAVDETSEPNTSNLAIATIATVDEEAEEPEQQDEYTQYEFLNDGNVASSNLFAINNNIREAGFDYFGRIPRSNRVRLFEESDVNVGASTSQESRASRTSTLAIATADEEVEEAEQQDEYTQYAFSDDGNVCTQQDLPELYLVEPIAIQSVPFDPFGEEIESLYVDEAIAIQSVSFDPFGAEIESLYQFDEVNAADETGKPNVSTLAIATVEGDQEECTQYEFLDQFDSIGETIEYEDFCSDQLFAEIFNDLNIDEAIPEDRETGEMASFPSGEARSTIAQQVLFNDFQPFDRLPNTPFEMSGRPRALSLDSHFNSAIEEQPTIVQKSQPIDQPGVSVVANKPKKKEKKRRPSWVSLPPNLDTIDECDEGDEDDKDDEGDGGDLGNLFP